MSSPLFVCFILLFQLYQIKCHVFMLPETYYNDTLLEPGQEIVFRVINGQPAKLGQFPYQVAIMHPVGNRRKGQPKTTNYQAICGGSIITKTSVLSAAHCFAKDKIFDCFKGTINNADVKDVYVVAGILKSTAAANSEGQWRTIRRGRYPSTYAFPTDDIALLVLKTGFAFDNQNVGRIGFARKKEDYNGPCVVSGYGRTSKIVQDSQSSVLRFATIRALSFKVCNQIHRKDMSKFICTSDEVSDVYKGDSGGPLVCTTGNPLDSKYGTLVGITCAGSLAKSTTAFTRVSAFLPFLAKKCSRNYFSLILIIMPFISNYISYLYIL